MFGNSNNPNLTAFISADNRDFLNKLRQSGAAFDQFGKRIANRSNQIYEANRSVNNYFGNLIANTNKAGGAVTQFTRRLETMGNVFTTGLGLGVAYMGVNALTGAFTRAIEKAQQFETGILAIAASQSSAFDIKLGDEVLQGVEAFRASAAIAAETNERLLERSTKNILSYREQMQAYLVATSDAAILNLSMDEHLALSENLAVAAKAIGLSGQQISEQVRAILAGANVQKTRLGGALGLMNEDITRMKEMGTTFEELMDRTKGFTDGSEYFEASIEGMRSQFENAIDIFLAKGGKEIAEALRQPMEQIKEFLHSTGGEDFGRTLGEMFANVLKVLMAIAESPALKIIERFLSFIADISGGILLVAIFAKLAGVIKVVSGAAASLVLYLKQIALNSKDAAAGLTMVGAAGQTVPRGASSPFRGQPPTRMFQDSHGNWMEGATQNKGGQWIDPVTGRFAKTQQVMSPAMSGAGAGAATAAGMQGLSKTMGDKMKGMFASAQQKLAAVDVNKFAAKAGGAAMMVGLLQYAGQAIEDKTSDAVQPYVKGATDVISGAAAGFMIGGPVGAIAGTLVGFMKAGYDAMAGYHAKLEDQTRSAYDAIKKMEQSNPALLEINRIKDQIEDLQDTARARKRSGDSNTKVNKKVINEIDGTIEWISIDIATYIKELEGEIEKTRKRESGLSRVATSVESFEERLAGIAESLEFLPDGLDKDVKTGLLKLTENLQKIANLKDLRMFAEEGETQEETRTRVMQEYSARAHDEVQKKLRDAAKEIENTERSFFSAGQSIKKAKQELDNFTHDLPRVRTEAWTTVTQANKTYLSSLTTGSEVVGSLTKALDERREAEYRSTQFSNMFGTSQQETLKALYGFTGTISAASIVQEQLNTGLKEHRNAVNELKKSMKDSAASLQRNAREQDSINTQLSDLRAAYRRTADNLKNNLENARRTDREEEISATMEANRIRGEMAGHSQSRIDKANADLEKELKAIQLQKAEERAMSARSGATQQQVIADYNSAVAGLAEQEANLSTRLMELRGEQLEIEKQVSDQRKELLEAQTALKDATTQATFLMSDKFSKYINVWDELTQNVVRGQIALDYGSLVVSHRTYQQTLDGLGDRTVELRMGVEDATRGFIDTKDKLAELRTQLSEASNNLKNNINKIMFDSLSLLDKESPLGGLNITVPINIPIALEETIDPAKLGSEVEKFIDKYVKDQCRGAKR